MALERMNPACRQKTLWPFSNPILTSINRKGVATSSHEKLPRRNAQKKLPQAQGGSQSTLGREKQERGLHGSCLLVGSH